MDKKISAFDVEFDEYFNCLRSNLALGQIALMQLSVVAARHRNALRSAEDLILNLHFQEQALNHMLAISVARLFDKSGKNRDQISIPNIINNKNIVICDGQRERLERLVSLPEVRNITSVRNTIVAHSLSHASRPEIQAEDFQKVIDECFSVLADIYKTNKRSDFLEREDLTKYRDRWIEMTKDWS